jgi:hypothetical protein
VNVHFSGESPHMAYDNEPEAPKKRADVKTCERCQSPHGGPRMTCCKCERKVCQRCGTIWGVSKRRTAMCHDCNK